MEKPQAGEFAHLANAQYTAIDALEAHVSGIPIPVPAETILDQDREREAIRCRDTALLVRACEKLMEDVEYLRNELGKPYVQNTGWELGFQALRNFRVNGKHLADARQGQPQRWFMKGNADA